MEKLYEILKSLHPDVDFTAQNDLIGEGILCLLYTSRCV